MQKNRSVSGKYLKALLYFSVFANVPAYSGTPYTVTSLGDYNPATEAVIPGSLRDCIDQANRVGGSGSTITFMPALSGTITLHNSLPPIGPNITSISSNGNAVTINGNNTYAAFYFAPLASPPAMAVPIGSTFQVVNAASIGGNGGNGVSNGGGGALGAGGGLFVGDNCKVTISGASLFSGCKAVGGAGGNSTNSTYSGGGGGGGMNGGNGGSTANTGFADPSGGGGGGFAGAGGSTFGSSGGGGGGGLFFAGGNTTNIGGGGGGSDTSNGVAGTDSGGNGGNGGQGSSGVFGAGGVGQSQTATINGGNGTGLSGGGGGGAITNAATPGGNGGSSALGGGGGGTSYQGVSGNGGSSTGQFGGGGGGAAFGSTGSSGHAGNGGNGSYGGGGGGAGGGFDNSVVVGGVGGNGGFGGGGGGASGQPIVDPGNLGRGGFGAGGGGGYTNATSGISPFGGGNGGVDMTFGIAGGGGGGALGGTVFVSQGAILTIQDPFQTSISSGTSTAGSGGVVVGASGIGSGAAGQALGPDIFLMSSGTIIFNQSTQFTVTNPIAGNNGVGGGSTTTGGITMNNASGTLVLGNSTYNNANTYTGLTTLNSGTVQIFSDNNLGAAANTVVLNSGTLEITGPATLNGSRAVQIAAPSTILIDPNVTAQIAGQITDSGAGGLLTVTSALSGPGTLYLKNAANSYTNGTTVSNNTTVQIDNPGGLGAAVGTNELTLDNGTLELLPAYGNATFNHVMTVSNLGGKITQDLGSSPQNPTFNATTTLNGPLTVSAANGSSVSMSNLVGPGSLTVATSGVILTGTNNYVGSTTIDSYAYLISTTLTSLPDHGVTTNGDLYFQPPATLTFNSVIGGTGVVVMNSGSTLILANSSNSYNGNFIYANGTMQVTNDHQLGALTGTITFNVGTLDLPLGTASYSSVRPIQLLGPGIISVDDVATTLTLTGTVYGAGTFTKNGPGTIVLQGANSFTGTTTVAAGTLQINSAGSLPSSNSVINNGKLIFNHSGTLSSSGLFSGTGSLTMQGSGILQLKNSSNSYSGGTFLNGGTIQASSNGDLGNPSGALNFNGGILELSGFFLSSRTINLNNPSGGIIAVDNNTFASLSGTINGPGGLTTMGPGVLFLNGNNTIPTINVLTGTLIVPTGITITSTQMTIKGGATTVVDGTVSSPITVVGTLEGTGTVGDAVTGVNVLGTISPGNADGSIVPLNGTKFNFNPASTFILSLNDTMSDQIIATGDVTINNAFLRINPISFTSPSVTSYPIITTMGNLTETSPFILINPLTRYSFSVQYNTGPMGSAFLVINGTPIPFHVIIPSGNAGAAANCFDALITQNLPDLTPVVNILDLMTPNQMAKAFNQMQPANFNNIAFAQENVAERIRQIYTNHFLEQRVVGCEENSQWRLWASPFVERVQQHGTSKLPGYLEKFSGFSTAFDYRTQKHWMFTAGFSYASSELNVPNGRTEADFKTYAGTIGTAWTGSSFFADALFSYLYSPIDAKRKIQFGVATVDLTSNVDRTAKHEDDSNQVLGHLGGGYDFKIKATKTSTYNIYPFVNVDYMYLSQDGYTEHGAGSLDLKVHDKSYDYLRPEGGIGIGYSGCFKHIEALFDLSVSYIHEFRFLGEKTSSRFKPGSCTFTVTGLKPENNLVSPTARLRLTSPVNGFSLMLGYHGEYGEHFIMNAGEAELRKAF